ncbi:nucleotidyltransferase domain-containing protein [filamentous cyanobacterium CCT1]|nr:nucleotidyltransferase domain-containing protein [filamentous cyanobacterium CCT1]PSN75921.1 nucleotidyltransferase domain-containing protein [filamentous cyanobacterium CCP4]
MVTIPTLTPELLKQMTEAIVQAVAPEQIVLFGSRAKGLDRPDSDIDFLIVEAKPFGLNHSRRKESAKVWKALAPFGIPADVLMFSAEEIAKWQHSRNHVISRAIAEGKVLYERS